MAKKKRAPRNVIELAVSRLGLSKGYRVCLFIACWVYQSEELGRPPATVDEYAEYWGFGRDTGFREQRLFRQCFPDLETPTALWERWRREHPELAVEADKRRIELFAVKVGGMPV